jgi:hypothetical protein
LFRGFKELAMITKVMTYLTAISFIGMLALSGAFYFYYNSTQNKMTSLIQNNSKLELAIETNENTITSLNENYERVNSELSSVYADVIETRRQNRLLVEKFENNDIGFLAENKPQLVENIINRASGNVMRCFELMSGAPLTEGERNAKTPTEFNAECPWIFNDTLNR